MNDLIKKGSNLIQADALHALLDEQNLVIFDCCFDLQDTNLWAQRHEKEHIRGAYYAHLNKDLSAPPGENGAHPLPTKQAFLQFLQKRGVNQDSLIVAYDNLGGGLAARLWWMAKWIGHANVRILEGGINAWIEKKYPLTQGITAFKQGAVSLGEPLVQTFCAEQVEQNLLTKKHLLIDSRAKERYAGASEPLYAKAGHIPGAKNRFFLDNLDQNSCFKPTTQLKEDLRALFGSYQADHVVFYCGSGVTACHNIIAAEEAGLSGSKLYVGSFSEWIEQEQHPVALGTED